MPMRSRSPTRHISRQIDGNTKALQKIVQSVAIVFECGEFEIVFVEYYHALFRQALDMAHEKIREANGTVNRALETARKHITQPEVNKLIVTDLLSL
jgi:hypothetical protein